MASNSGAISWFSARTVGQARLAALAVCGAMALASAAVADPIEVALIESLTSVSPGVESMDYVQTGQVIRLAPNQTIVLSYMSSCLRETITGGTVTVGTDWSEVQSGEVQRTRGQCDFAGKMVLTDTQQRQTGGKVFRGLAGQPLTVLVPAKPSEGGWR
jgi:hypothetical protein